MSNFLNEKAAQLAQGGIRAFFDKAKNIKNAINMGIGEPDFTTPADIIEASYKAMLDGKTHYTANGGDLSVRDSISKYLSTYNADYKPQNEIIITCGGMGAVAMCLLCCINPGDEVIVQDPQWLNYMSQIRFAGGCPVQVPVIEENGFSLNVKEIESHITKKTKVIMINSPNNPTGAVLDKKVLSEISELAIRYDLLVISDEVYCELLFDGLRHHTIAAMPGMHERTIIVNSLSKTFAMTGWRLGFAAGPSEIISKMTILQENLVSCAPSPAQFAAKFALETMCGVSMMRDLYEKRRNIVVDGLNAIKGIHCIKPSGSFYVFPSIKEFGLTSSEFAEKMMEEVGVVTIPGSSFGPSGEGYLRLAYANSEENLTESIRRIELFTKTLSE